MFFEAPKGMYDTWHVLGGPRGAMCQAMGDSNIELKWGTHGRHGMMPLEGNLKWLDKMIRCNPLNQ